MGKHSQGKTGRERREKKGRKKAQRAKTDGLGENQGKDTYFVLARQKTAFLLVSAAIFLGGAPGFRKNSLDVSCDAIPPARREAGIKLSNETWLPEKDKSKPVTG